MRILNLTQHKPTAAQAEAGVFDLEDTAVVKGLLTFDTLPTAAELTDRAEKLVQLAQGAGADAAMIGGAPFFMGVLENALCEAGITALYAFSVRESVEVVREDGSVEKRAIFAHRGFVNPRG